MSQPKVMIFKRTTLFFAVLCLLVSLMGSDGARAPAAVQPPLIFKAFNAPSVQVGGTVSLSLAVANPNSAAPLTNVAFGDNLPSGLMVATPNGLQGDCSNFGGMISAVPGSSLIALSKATLLPGAGCSFSLNITAITPGTKMNETSKVTSDQGTGLTAKAPLTVTDGNLGVTFGCQNPANNYWSSVLGPIWVLDATAFAFQLPRYTMDRVTADGGSCFGIEGYDHVKWYVIHPCRVVDTGTGSRRKVGLNQWPSTPGSLSRPVCQFDGFERFERRADSFGISLPSRPLDLQAVVLPSFLKGAGRIVSPVPADPMDSSFSSRDPDQRLFRAYLEYLKYLIMYSNINTDTGNLVVKYPLFFKPTASRPLGVTLFYNNQDTSNGVTGTGWTFNFNLELAVSGNRGAERGGDGQRRTYTQSDPTTFKPDDPGNFNRLMKNTDGTFTLILPDGTLHHFPAPGAIPAMVDSISDLNGNRLAFSYDSGGRLANVADSSSGRSISFAYTGSHLTQVGDPVTLGYDSSGRLISITDQAAGVTRFAYDSANNLIQITDALGNVRRFTYDSAKRVTSAVDELGNTTTYAYGAAGTTITDPLGHVTTVVHNQHRWMSVTDALGGKTTVTRDANNMITGATNPLGNTWHFTYDANGNNTGGTDPLGASYTSTYNTLNEPLTITDALGHATSYAYDAKGNLTKITDASGGIVTYTRDSRGLPLTRTNRRGVSTQFSWSAAANLVSKTDAAGTSVATTTTYAYDALGRLTSRKDAVPSITNYAYDGLSRLTKITEAAGSAQQRISSYAYDGDSRLISTTDPRGIITTHAYDAAGRLIQTVDASGLTSQRTTSFQYDADGNLVAFVDPRANKWQYTYDALNRRIQITDPLGNMTDGSYDAAGNLTRFVDGNSNTNTFAYDAANRLVAKNYFDGKNVQYTYDAAGNRAGMTDFRGATTYAYDPLNRPVTITNPDGTTLHYQYDAEGNLTSRTYPDARVETLSYDQLNRVLQSKDVNGGMVTRTYDPGGRLKAISRSNGATSAFTYDALSRLVSEKHNHASTLLSGQTIGYDPDDNPTKITSALGGVESNVYDALNRIVKHTAANGAITNYTYDPADNRTSVQTSSSTTNAVFDAANEMVKFGSAVLSYDRNKNLLSDGTLTYSYDAAGRLASAHGGPVNSKYSYDGDGRRVTQQVAAGTYQYVNDLRTGKVLVENGPDGKILYTYSGPDRDSAVFPATQFFYHNDAFGSVATVTDPTGKLLENYSYDPWGQMLTVIDPLGTKNKYRFGSEETDPGTGLTYTGREYYNPKWGRSLGANH